METALFPLYLHYMYYACVGTLADDCLQQSVAAGQIQFGKNYVVL